MNSSFAFRVPCIVAARALCSSLSFAPALVQLGDCQELVWVSREDFLLDSQPPSPELKGSVEGRIVREEGDSVVISVRSRGIEKELNFDRALIPQLPPRLQIAQISLSV